MTITKSPTQFTLSEVSEDDMRALYALLSLCCKHKDDIETSPLRHVIGEALGVNTCGNTFGAEITEMKSIQLRKLK